MPITIDGNEVHEITLNNQVVGEITINNTIAFVGWSRPHLYRLGALESVYTEGQASSTGSVSKESDHLYLTCANSSSTAYRSLVATRTIAWAGYTTLHVDWEGGGNDTSTARMAGIETPGSAYNVYIARAQRNTGFSRLVDNISLGSLSGDVGVKFTVVDTDGKNSRTAWIRVYRVWLS